VSSRRDYGIYGLFSEVEASFEILGKRPKLLDVKLLEELTIVSGRVCPEKGPFSRKDTYNEH
jgi:hypothetical protein